MRKDTASGGEGFLVLVLELVELVVEAVAGEELLVGALLAELAFVHDEDGVCGLDGGEAVGDEDAGAAGDHAGEGGRTRSSVSVSTELVASSRMRMPGSWARARAKEMSCFWPVERPAPRSRTGSLKASGQGADEVGDVDFVGGLFDARVGDAGGAEADVVGDGAGEEEGVL